MSRRPRLARLTVAAAVCVAVACAAVAPAASGFTGSVPAGPASAAVDADRTGDAAYPSPFTAVAGTGDGAKNFRFAFTGTRTPGLTWDACTPIRWGVDATMAAKHGSTVPVEVRRWKRVVREAATYTGYTFRFVGTIRGDVRPTAEALGLGPTTPGVDLTVVYGTADAANARYREPRLAGPAGVGGTIQRDGAVKYGYVVLDAKFLREAKAMRPPRGVDPFTSLALHELGHALTLAHVTDPRQTMYPLLSRTRDDRYHAGDVAGLRTLSRVPCRTPEP